MNHRIPPRTGAAFTLQRGDRIRIIDAEGGQVADVYAVAVSACSAPLCNGGTFDSIEVEITRG